MENLKTAMALNYRQHPAFVFEQDEWEVNPKLLEVFDCAVCAHRNCAARLRKKSEVALFEEVTRSLRRIFDALLQQANDKHERLFLQELGGSVQRLLDEERKWYSKPGVNRSISLGAGKTLDNAIRLQTDRHFYGALSKDAVNEIKRISEDTLGRFRVNAANGKLKREDLSINGGPVVRAIRGILNREFRKLGVLDAVSAYAGRPMTVTGLALEMSVPQATWWRNSMLDLPRAPHTLYAHLDESVIYPKSIVYLTDVTEKQGPTSCYPAAYEAMKLGVLQELIGRVLGTVGNSSQSPLHDYYEKQYHQSVNSEKFRRHFMLLPEALRFNSHLGWDVVPESSLEDSLQNCENTMTGPAGTFITFDGARLLHRGGLMQEGERIALQVVFSDITLLNRVVGKAKRMLA